MGLCFSPAPSTTPLDRCANVCITEGRTVDIKQYRIEAGHYKCGDLTILWGGPSYWQVRNQWDDIIEDFRTLRDALKYALWLQRKRNTPNQ